jgi:hypothetical protein
VEVTSVVDVEAIHAVAAVEAVGEADLTLDPTAAEVAAVEEEGSTEAVVEGGLMEVVAEAEVDSTIGEEEDAVVEALYPEAALPAVVEEVAGDLRQLLFLGKFVPSCTTTVLTLASIEMGYFHHQTRRLRSLRMRQSKAPRQHWRRYP